MDSQTKYNFQKPGLKTDMGLKRGVENGTFWSEIGPGFREPGGTALPRIPGSNPPPAPSSSRVKVRGHLVMSIIQFMHLPPSGDRLQNTPWIVEYFFTWHTADFTCMTASKSRLAEFCFTNQSQSVVNYSPSAASQGGQPALSSPEYLVKTQPNFVFFPFLRAVLHLACVQTSQAVFFGALQVGYPLFVLNMHRRKHAGNAWHENLICAQSWQFWQKKKFQVIHHWPEAKWDLGTSSPPNDAV